MSRTFIDAADAAARLNITTSRLYALVRKQRVTGVREATETFRKAHMPEQGASPPCKYMFDPLKLAIKSKPHGNRKYAEDERVRVFARTTDVEADRWKLAAEKAGEDVAVWARGKLNHEADRLGIPRDPDKVAALVKEHDA